MTSTRTVERTAPMPRKVWGGRDALAAKVPAGKQLPRASKRPVTPIPARLCPMSLFLVGGPHDASLQQVYDEFIDEARPHGDRVGIAVTGPAEQNQQKMAELSQIVSSRSVSYTHLTLPTNREG